MSIAVNPFIFKLADWLDARKGPPASTGGTGEVLDAGGPARMDDLAEAGRS